MEVKANLNALKVKVASIETLLKGGIVLTNKYRLEDSSVSKPYKYKIYSDFDDLPIKKHNINLVFTNIEGLDTKDAKLVYKGIKVGKIIDIKLNENLQVLNAKAYLYDEFKNLASKTSVFYIVKPNISLQGVSGLDTIIKGSYINIIKGEGALASSFDVYSNRPQNSKLQKGLRVTLRSKNSASLSLSSSVYYKKIKVGEIENIDLNTNAKFVNINLFIYDRYKKLVRVNSNFYNVSGIDMDISLVGGAKIKADSLSTVILGGVSFSTPNEYGKKAMDKRVYTLYDEAKIEWKNYNPEIILD